MDGGACGAALLDPLAAELARSAPIRRPQTAEMLLNAEAAELSTGSPQVRLQRMVLDIRAIA